MQGVPLRESMHTGARKPTIPACFCKSCSKRSISSRPLTMPGRVLRKQRAAAEARSVDRLGRSARARSETLTVSRVYGKRTAAVAVSFGRTVTPRTFAAVFRVDEHHGVGAGADVEAALGGGAERLAVEDHVRDRDRVDVERALAGGS